MYIGCVCKGFIPSEKGMKEQNIYHGGQEAKKGIEGGTEPEHMLMTNFL